MYTSSRLICEAICVTPEGCVRTNFEPRSGEKKCPATLSKSRPWTDPRPVAPLMEPQALVESSDGIAEPMTQQPPEAGMAATPEPAPATTSGGAAKRPTGRRRSRSFYGSENHPDPVPVTALPPRPSPQRKNTGLNLDALVFQLTLKECIEKEVARLQQEGSYEEFGSPGDPALFDEEATEILRKCASFAEFKQFRNTPEGQILLKKAIGFFKLFEVKEAKKECFNELDFHTKCLVDDILFHFLVDAPSNVKG